MSTKERIIEWEELNVSEEMSQSVNGIFTPLGVLQLSSENTPVSKWRIFLGETTFSIEEPEAACLSDISGIEMMHVFSRYTMLIAIGKLFNWSEVKTEIDYRLCGSHINDFQIIKIEDEQVRANVIEAKRGIAKYDNWAIYVCPNGAITHIECQEANPAYKNKLQTLKEALVISNGILLSSEFK